MRERGSESSGSGGVWGVFLVGAVVVGGTVAYSTYGEAWREKRDESGQIVAPFIEFMNGSDPLATATTMPRLQGSAENQTDEAQLLALGPWCSDFEWKINDEQTVNICLDEASLSVWDGRIYGTLRTEPFIDQTVNGNPSLFLTFEHENMVQICDKFMPEIKEELQADVNQVLGAEAVSYTIDLHLDPRNTQHPCDDPLPEE
jgi:hypothetical protein